MCVFCVYRCVYAYTGGKEVNSLGDVDCELDELRVTKGK